MIVEARIAVNGSRSALWGVITDIGNAAKIITGIESIEILEKPASGLVGLRWRETRMFGGKPATVEKRITEAAENEFYTTRAEGDGFVFHTTKRISEGGGGVEYIEIHDSTPQGFVRKLLSIPMGLLFKGMMKKLVMQDMNDVKAAVERGH